MHILRWSLVLCTAACCLGYVYHAYQYNTKRSSCLADALFEDEMPKLIKGSGRVTVALEEPPVVSKGARVNYDDELNGYFKSFMKIIDSNNDLSTSWDYENAQNFHLQILLTLVKSDTQDREIEQSLVLKRFPSAYIIALEQIQLILDRLKSENSILLPIASLIHKKEGLRSTSKLIVPLKNGLKTMIPYEIVSVKRKTERCLSLLLTLLTSYSSCKFVDSHSHHPSTVYVDNFLYFSKTILEKLPMHEKHLSFLTYCRGIVFSNFNEKSNNLLRKVHSGVSKMHQNQVNESNIKQIYLNSFRDAGMSQPPVLLRLVYPLLYTSYTRHVMDTNSDNVFDSSLRHPGDKLASWLKQLIDSDRGADMTNSIEGTAENIIYSINKLFNSILALHFINDYPYSDTLSKAVKENTVAMELLCTHKAFCEAYYSDSYIAVLQDVGSYMNLLMQVQDQPLTFIVNTKKIIAIVDICVRSNSMKYLQPLLDGTNIHVQSLTDYSDDDIFADTMVKSGYRKKSSTDPVDDSLFWVGGRRTRPKGAQSTTQIVPSLQSNALMNIDKVLLRLVAIVVGVEAKAILDNPNIIFEVLDTFTTWRKPQLLLEYCSMHSSSPEVQSLFRRFLRALWGVSNETVDDIRYKDEGNMKHLKLLPPQLLNDWIEGRSHSTGKLLPGYTDPQTIFMLGEDSNTCMGIRSRQKGTNRGLLSFLLHGNNRILGVKDSSGKLIARARVLLLLDTITNQPVLFVETPYTCHSYQFGAFEDGDDENILEIYDQAAELGQCLQVPVVYSVPPPISSYVMSENEASAIQLDNGDIDSFASTSTDATMIYNTFNHTTDSNGSTNTPVYNVVHLADYTCLASYVWIEGIKNPLNTQVFLPNHFPSLIRREKNRPFVPAGIRTIGTLEKMPFKIMESPRTSVASHSPNNVNLASGNSQKLKGTNKKSLQEKLIERKNALISMTQKHQLNRMNHSNQQEQKAHTDDHNDDEE